MHVFRMDTNPLFTLALGLSHPWKVIATSFDPSAGQLDLGIDFETVLRNASDLTEKQTSLVSDITQFHYVLGEAWKLKESFRDFWKQPNLEAARNFLLEWIATAIAKDIAPMVKVAWTLWEHHRGILQLHLTGISNGILEGLNSLIQAAKAKARGYRNHDNLITIEYLIAGKLKLPTYPLGTA